MLSHALWVLLNNHIKRPNANQGLLFDAYNEFAEVTNQSKIYDLDVLVLTSMYEGRSHLAFYNAIAHANFDRTEKYFYLDGFGRAVTFTEINQLKCPINMEPFVEWLGEEDRYQRFDFFVDM